MSLRAMAMVAALALSAQEASAIPVTTFFSGDLRHVTGNFDPETGLSDGFGFGFEVGDEVLGAIAYDPIDGSPFFLGARVGGQVLVATNLTVRAQQFDGFMTWFYILGELDNGLFMSFGLWSGIPAFTGSLPSSLSSEDWRFSAFKISATRWAPIEVGSSEIESIYAHNLDVRTVPEPPITGLLALGLLILVVARMRLGAPCHENTRTHGGNR